MYGIGVSIILLLLFIASIVVLIAGIIKKKKSMIILGSAVGISFLVIIFLIIYATKYTM